MQISPYLHRLEMDLWYAVEALISVGVSQALKLGIPAGAVQKQTKHSNAIFRGGTTLWAQAFSGQSHQILTASEKPAGISIQH